MCLFFYLHFTWLYGSWHLQRILKKYPFWKYDSCFSSEVLKLTSVGSRLNLLLKYWFMEAKFVVYVCHGPKKWSKYHLETIQVKILIIKGHYLWESCFSMPENASFFEEFAEVNFETSEENQLKYFQNGYFFKILWGCHEPYNRVKCR